jgi:Dolichyl-phosphate-mannose-protein mannosyltransferase
VSEALPPRSDALVFFAASTFVLHLATAGRYGYHRDELYFIACARHLAWGYVDQPPMIAVIAGAAMFLFGHSLYALRSFSALAAALIVVTSGLTARRLGGGAVAQGFAMLAVAAAPFYLAVGNLLTMNAFEPLFWISVAYLLMDILDEKPGLWSRPLLGVVIGLGILMKYTIGLFVLSLWAAMFASPQRRLMQRADFSIVPGVATLLAAPNVLWQYAHGWPQFVVLRNAMLHKDITLGPVVFALQQALMVNPLTLPLWIAGLFFFLRRDNGRYNIFFWSYALLFITDVALSAKVYYLAPIYPVLFAGGACATEAWLARSPARRIGYAVSLTLAGAIILPQVIPILPLPTFLAYQHLVDFRQIKGYKHDTGLLPEQYADMLGWDRLVEQVASVYSALPSMQRARTAIWAENYGQAAAIDALGEQYGLPKAISGHNNYYLWGTRGYDGSSVIAIGVPESLTRMEFRQTRRAATFADPYVLPQQNNVSIALCTRPREPLAVFWPRTKAYW